MAVDDEGLPLIELLELPKPFPLVVVIPSAVCLAIAAAAGTYFARRRTKDKDE